MRFLFDSNILIPAEPTSPGDIEPTTPATVALLRGLAIGSHQPMLHPASAAEIGGDRKAERARARALLLGKYPVLEHPPGLASRLVAVLGAPTPGSNNEVDLLLLSAVEANAVDYLVTEDDGIHRRARRVGLADRVLTIADATLTVRALFPTVPETPPLVRAVMAYQLDEHDPIFSSFRVDYPDFDKWMARCRLQHRQAWVVQIGSGYGGICIVKDESTNDYGFAGRVLKICSFKISDQHRGYRYGELLLKAIFGYAVENRFDAIFVEAYAKHSELFALLADFGFEDVRESSKGERVLLKRMAPASTDARLGPLDFNIRYGPHALSLVGASVFVVPIRPAYHRLLFPEAEEQLSLPTESHPFGNSIRKAYLSNSLITKLAPGDVLLFYRSTMDQAVTAIGVVEQVLRSTDAAHIARFVGRRTVYSLAEIELMATKSTLAVLFRLARTLRDRWEVDLLKRAGILQRAPQSFMQVHGKGIDWIATQLNAPR
jgi:GNAT superfamily N-acetyltransferase